MRAKPDLKDFKDPTDFLESGSADKAEKVNFAKSSKKNSTITIQQKIFRLPLDVVNALKLHVAQQQVESGKKITETEIIEKLLRKYLNI